MSTLLIVAAALLQSPPAEKIEIRVRPKEGDRIETWNTWTHSFRGSLGEEPLRFATRGGQRLVSEMAKVEGGRVIRKKVHVADSYLEKQDAQTGKYIRTDDAIHGREVTIDRTAKGETRTGVDGVPEPELVALTLDDPLARLFPTGPVAVGDTWEISGEGLKAFYPRGDFTEGRIVVVLRDVREFEGRRCAFLGTNFDVSIGAPSGLKRELRLKGMLTVWIDRGYVLAMTQSGRMTTTGADPKTSEPNGEAAVTGELKATILETPK
jgi:hypothetical protein